jgi:hypothetical protein
VHLFLATCQPSSCGASTAQCVLTDLQIFNSGRYGPCLQSARPELCRRGEVLRRWRAGRGGVRPASTGAAGAGRVVRGESHRPGGGRALPGDPDVGEPVTPRADRRRRVGAGLERPRWGLHRLDRIELVGVWQQPDAASRQRQAERLSARGPRIHLKHVQIASCAEVQVVHTRYRATAGVYGRVRQRSR